MPKKSPKKRKRTVPTTAPTLTATRNQLTQQQLVVSN